MKRRTCLFFVLMAWLALALSAAAGASQDPPPPAERKCLKCHSLGRLPCEEVLHDRTLAEQETELLYCSFAAGCARCGGTAWLDCPACEHLDAQAWLERRRGEVAARKLSLATLDREMRRELRKGESDNFILVWELDSLKVGKVRLDAHQLLHLYLERLETLHSTYLQVLAADPRDFQSKSRVFVWWLPSDQLEASLRFCQNSGATGVKLLGSSPNYSMCGAKQFVNDDEQLHRNLVHNVTHLLMSHQNPSYWVGNQQGGWADEGLAHWMEDHFFGICDNYCYEEQNSNQDFKAGKWKPAVRKLVALDNVPPIAEVFQQNTDTLTLPQHAVSFSYVDYLLTLDGAKANRLFKQMRQRLPTREALQNCFEILPLQFEERWKAWVLETYPQR